MNCFCCHSALHSFIQEPLLPGRPAREYVECHNPACPEWMQTLEATHYATINALQVAGAVLTAQANNLPMQRQTVRAS